MEIRPIKSNKRLPKYPTMDLFVNNPQLLSKSIPEKWLSNSLVLGSLTAFILCGNTDKAYTQSSETTLAINIENEKQNAVNKKDIKSTKSVLLAPVFAHGRGPTADVCIAISPPVFITESDARQIIIEAFKAENIELDTVNCPKINIEAPPLYDIDYRTVDTIQPKVKVDVITDAFNKKYNLAIEFISYEEVEKFSSQLNSKKLQDENIEEYYPTKKAAEIIQNEILKDNKLNAIIFYDPLTYISRGDLEFSKKYEYKSEKEKVKKQLLNQVEDFIKWIKKEGIIK